MKLKSLIEGNKIFDMRSSTDKVDKLIQIELKKIDASVNKDAKIKKGNYTHLHPNQTH